MLSSEVLQLTGDRLLESLASSERNADPIKWAEYMLGEEFIPHRKTREAVRSFMDNKYSLYYGVNSSGKSFFMIGALSLWWLDVYGNAAKVVVVSPSFQQSKGAMGYVYELNEVINKRYSQGLINHNIGGRIIKEVEYKVKGSGGITALNPAPHEARDRIRGPHTADFEETGAGTLVILEESAGLADKTVRAAMTMVGGQYDKMTAISNPNNPDSYVMRLVQKYKETGKSKWGIVNVSAFDLPVYTGEEVGKIQRAGLMQKGFVEEVISTYGEDSPEYNILVLGEPDWENQMSVISLSDVNVGINTEYPSGEFEPAPIVNIDLALWGKDNTVMYDSWEKTIVVEEEVETEDEIQTVIRDKDICMIRFAGEITGNDVNQKDQAIWALDHVLKIGAKEIRFDASNVGATFEAELHEILLSKGYAIVSPYSYARGKHEIRLVKMHAGAIDFPNDAPYRWNKDWFWGNMKERLRDGQIDLDPEDTQLHKELMVMGYKLDVRNRMCTDPKRKLSKSPDYADAALFAAIPASAIDYIVNKGIKNTSVELVETEEDFEVDPFAEYFPEEFEIFGF